ncbi:MAG TPA: hypothetical protein VFE14_04325, partial [Micromonosporaceae bacterium]|nr:hypothetical protein [Micromonosporaceae bacterium]
VAALAGRHPVRWVALVAAAAAVAVVAAGVGIVQARTAPPPLVSTSPSPPTPSGVVPFAALAPGGVPMPEVTIPASPDPALARALPPCRADRVTVELESGASSGIRYLAVRVYGPARAPCRLGGRPTVVPLGKNRRLPIPVEADRGSDRYGGAVAVTSDHPALLFLNWSSDWCAAPVDNDRLDITLPDGGGTLHTGGFGASECSGTAGSGRTPPIVVPAFTPEEFNPAHTGTAFHDVEVSVAPPYSAPAGGRLATTVTLTAPAGPGVPLAPCPDYRVGLYLSGDASNAFSTYALNCAAVPYRDAAGQPYLPAGVPVTFAIEVPVPATPGDGKLTWQLVVPDPIVGGHAVLIH